MSNEEEETKEHKRFVHQHKIETVFIDEYYGKVLEDQLCVYFGTRRGIPPTGGDYLVKKDKTYRPPNSEDDKDEYQVALQICFLMPLGTVKGLIDFLNNHLDGALGKNRIR